MSAQVLVNSLDANSLDWIIPVSDPTLQLNAAHVWQADLNVAAAQISHWQRFLSADERERAAQFLFARDREQFVAARGLLRELLGFYTKTLPSQLRFAYNAWGKPFLQAPEPRQVFFNVSHSCGRALLAFAWGEVGTDIERIRERVDARMIATALSSPERRALQTLANDNSHAALLPAFFQLWTRKEAFFKADGCGLMRTLHDFDVSDAETSVSWSRIKVWNRESQTWRKDARWNLRVLEVGQEHAAAVVVANPVRQLNGWNWNG